MPNDHRQLAVFDDRPFFERALAFGVRAGILADAKIAAIVDDGPKGMVQIAEYFGTQYLRPNIDEARQRIVNLVSLFLEEQSGGDLEKAAHSLRDGSFSVAFARRLGNAEKPLGNARGCLVRNHDQAVPESCFSPTGRCAVAPTIARRAPERQDHQQTIDTALWFAERLGVAAAELSTVAAESVIRSVRARSSQLQRAAGNPHRRRVSCRCSKRSGSRGFPGKGRRLLARLLQELPKSYLPVVQHELQRIESEDLPRIADHSRPLAQLLQELEPLYHLRDFGPEDAGLFDGGSLRGLAADHRRQD
jgi:hypothetical protein